MRWPLWPKKKVEYHDTPQGILTESGIWYRTTVDLLNDYAGELFEREPLGVHLARSDIWIRSPHTLSLWLLAVGILFYTPWPLVIVIPIFFLSWQMICPALLNYTMLSLVRILDAVLLQAILYSAILSVLAIKGQFQALWIGMVGFIIFRWGVLTYVTRPLVGPCWQKMYKLPVPDHILRGCIIRSALRNGITLTNFKKIEQSILRYMLKRKNGGND